MGGWKVFGGVWCLGPQRGVSSAGQGIFFGGTETKQRKETVDAAMLSAHVQRCDGVEIAKTGLPAAGECVNATEEVVSARDDGGHDKVKIGEANMDMVPLTWCLDHSNRENVVEQSSVPERHHASTTSLKFRTPEFKAQVFSVHVSKYLKHVVQTLKKT